MGTGSGADMRVASYVHPDIDADRVTLAARCPTTTRTNEPDLFTAAYESDGATVAICVYA